MFLSLLPLLAAGNPAWLEKILAILPDLAGDRTYHHYENGTSLHTLLSCHLNFEHLQSEFLPPYTLSYRILTMSLNCLQSGTYTYTSPTINASDDLSATIDKIDLIINMTVTPINKTGPTLPNKVTLSQCSLHPRLNMLGFSGDYGGIISQEFYKDIKHHIEVEFPKETCESIVNVTQTLSDGVEKLVDLVAPFLEPPPPPSPPEIVSLYPLVNWNDLKPMFKIIQHFINHTEVVANVLIGTLGRPISYTNPDLVPLVHKDKFSLGIYAANISGLDQFSNISLLQPSADNNLTLNSDIVLDSLNISVILFAQVGTQSRLFTEAINIRLSNLTISAAALIAIRKEYFPTHQVRVHDFLNVSCMVNILEALNVTQLDVNIDLDKFEMINQNTEQPVDDIVNNIFAMLQSTFGSGMAAVVRGIIATPTRQLINNMLDEVISKANSTQGCPTHPTPTLAPNYTVWNDTKKLMKMMDFLMNEVDRDGVLPINSLIAAITEESGVRGGFKIPLPSFNLSIPIGKLKPFEFRIREPYILVNGLDTFHNNAVFRPVEGAPYNLSNTIGMGWPDAVNVSLITGLQVMNNGSEMINVDFIGVKLSLEEIKVAMTGMLRFNPNAIKNLFVERALNGSCMATAIETSQIHKMHVDFANLSLWLMQSPTDQDPLGEANDFHPDTFIYIIKTMINAQLDRITYRAPYVCNNQVPPSRDPPPSLVDSDFAHYFGGIAVFLAISLSVTAMVWFVWGREKKLVDEEPEANTLAQRLLDPTVSTDQPPSPWSGSLVFNPRIPSLIRIGVVVIILGDIVLFLTSNIASGAIVNMLLTTPGKNPGDPPVVHVLGDLFDFNLGNSIRHMWEADVFALSILIAAFSGAWTYSKLLLMLACWLAPPTSFLTPQRRERLLIMLDSLGKWSMIDAYVLVMMMVAFRFRIGSGGTYADVIVEAHYGFYGFTAAAIISLMISHVILFFHRYAEGHDPTSVNTGGKKEALRTHSYRLEIDPENVPSRQGSRFDRFKAMARSPNAFGLVSQWGIVVLLVFTAILIAVGADIDTFKFHFQGAAGFALGENTDRSFSLVSLGKQLPDATADPSSFGTSFIQTTYFMFALVLPLMHLACMVFLWVTPLTLKTQYWWFIICEVLNAWASLEVFISSVLASILEIETFAKFLVGNKCDAVVPVLERLLGINSCFAVGATLQSGSAVLFVASIITLVSGQVVMRNCHKALADRMAKDGYEHLAQSMGKGTRSHQSSNQKPKSKNHINTSQSDLPPEKFDDDEE